MSDRKKMFDYNFYPILERIAEASIQNNWHLAVAESCTGGLLASALTELAGSSQWFECGWVTYSNEAKINYLGVSKKILEQYGAVSSETVCAMVNGIFKNSIANLGISISGIAGPAGGTLDKPVGTVWIGYGLRDQWIKSQHFHFEGNRREIRMQSVAEALKLIEKCNKKPFF